MVFMVLQGVELLPRALVALVVALVLALVQHYCWYHHWNGSSSSSSALRPATSPSPLPPPQFHRWDKKPIERVNWGAAQHHASGGAHASWADWAASQRPRRPLVFQNTSASRWPAVNRWTPEYLARHVQVPISAVVNDLPLVQYYDGAMAKWAEPVFAAVCGNQHSDDNGGEEAASKKNRWPRCVAPQRPRKERMTMAEFWGRSSAAAVARQQQQQQQQQQHAGTGDDQRHYYGAERIVPSSSQRDEDDGGRTSATAVVGGLRLSRRLREDVAGFEGVLAPPHVPAHARRCHLWFGAHGVTKQAHYDETHNLYTQLVGTKRVILSPPRVAARQIHLFPRVHACHRHSMVEFGPGLAQPEKGWTHSFSAAELTELAAADDSGELLPIPAQEVVLQPGDTLYIPPYWLHRVESLGPAAVALSGWWRDAPLRRQPTRSSSSLPDADDGLVHPETAAAGLVAALRRHALPMATDRHFEEPQDLDALPCWPQASRCPGAFQLGLVEAHAAEEEEDDESEWVRASHKGWVWRTVVLVLRHHLLQAPGLGTVQLLLRQRYLPLYGPQPADRSFMELCEATADEAAMASLAMSATEREDLDAVGRNKRYATAKVLARIEFVKVAMKCPEWCALDPAGNCCKTIWVTKAVDTCKNWCYKMRRNY
jgi:hypothetical protein